jgi:hypothetical protein
MVLSPCGNHNGHPSHVGPMATYVRMRLRVRRRFGCKPNNARKLTHSDLRMLHVEQLLAERYVSSDHAISLGSSSLTSFDISAAHTPMALTARTRYVHLPVPGAPAKTTVTSPTLYRAISPLLSTRSKSSRPGPTCLYDQRP